jgi:DNA-binding NarL/FixJ family response regulator
VSPERVLFVDDELILLDSFLPHFRDAGYTVEKAVTGEEALQALEVTPFEILIVDLVLPDINGLEIIRKAKTSRPDITSIVLTGYADVQSAVASLHLHVDDYVEKPCEPEELIARMSLSVKRKKKERKETILLEALNLYKKQNRIIEQCAREVCETNQNIKKLMNTAEDEKNRNTEAAFSTLRREIAPLVEKLKETKPTAEQSFYLDKLEEMLRTMLDSFPYKLALRFSSLTPREASVAIAVRDGLSSKEIASQHHMAVRTVEVHRENIRKKMGIKNKNINLRSYLLSLDG